MPHWFGKSLCLIAVLTVSEAHLVLMQSWAWGTMLQDRAPERGVVEAIESTFSGDEPCPMCCAVQEEKQEQREEPALPERNTLIKCPSLADDRRPIFASCVRFYIKRAQEPHLVLVRIASPPPTPPPDCLA